jgi:hypothetical protein
MAMKEDRILEALATCEGIIQAKMIDPSTAPMRLHEDRMAQPLPMPEFTPRVRAVSHLRAMIRTSMDMVQEGRREKVMRWLGFIQGAMWAFGLVDITTLKRMNMPREGEE